MITLFTTIYVVCALLLALHTASQFILLWLYLHHRRRVIPTPTVHYTPHVAVQLPLYNEKYVVGTLLNAVAKLDYPRDCLTIQVLDDSTDDTAQIVAAKVTALRRTGLNIHHVRRATRSGYKAGALAYGLTLLPQAEYIAIFDADFVPPSDFLRLTIPHFAKNPKLGILQTRWGHLNATDNWLTRAQALAIDVHFIIEQTARNRAGLPQTFNGTGGVWRKQTIIDAGGWSAQTLTEDLDLSFRAQIRGWRYLYLPDVVVPGEIPSMMVAYKRQQARWAQGTNQCLVKLTVPVWRSRHLTPLQKLTAMQPLTQYLPHTFMLLLLLLTPPLIAADALHSLPVTPLGIVGLVPPLMHVLAQGAHERVGLRRLAYFPMLMLIGTGTVVNNAYAAYLAFKSAFTRQQHEFARTPKFGKTQGSAYALSAGQLVYAELALALYAAVGAVLALANEPALVAYMTLYSLSLFTVALWHLYDNWQIARLPIETEPSLNAEAEDAVAVVEMTQEQPETEAIYT
ncbi:MAG: glycosyltransferase [Armatimonadetes bacterium]|nr:glycosyltransferase [Anaerolineae bacterium]